MTFAAVPITGRTPASDEDVEALRQIRNAGRQWMTGSTAYISVAEQAAWWQLARLVLPHHFQVLVYVDPTGDRVGYGMIMRRFPGNLWASLGVRPDRRRQGIGVRIYQDLIRRAPEPLYVEIRTDNVASLRAAQKAGFRALSQASQGVICVANEPSA